MTSDSWKPRHPIDLAVCLDRHVRWGEDLVNVVRDHSLFRVGADGVPFRVGQLSDGAIRVEGAGDVAMAMAETRHRLAEALDRDELLAVADRVPAVGAQLDRLPGYRPPMNSSFLESLVTSICAQQVNLQWAATTRNRLVERFGMRHELDGVTVWRFPSAETLAGADTAEIRAMQFTQRKAEYIVGVAQELSDGRLDGIEDDDDGTVIARIMEIRGLGRWTAEWFLARTLARPDAIAAGDLGVRKAVSQFVAGSAENLSEDHVRQLTSDWGDGGNWAVHLLLEKLAEV